MAARETYSPRSTATLRFPSSNFFNSSCSSRKASRTNAEMAVSIPAKMSSSIWARGRMDVWTRRRPSSPMRNRSSVGDRCGYRFHPKYPAIPDARRRRPPHGLISTDHIDGRYDTDNDATEGDTLVFPVERVTRRTRGFVASFERSCPSTTQVQLAPPSTEISYTIAVPGGRVSFTWNDSHPTTDSAGRNGAVRRIPMGRYAPARLERRVTRGVPAPSVLRDTRHWRNRFGGLVICDPAAGAHGVHDGSPGDEAFPVLVSTVTEVAGGSAVACTTAAENTEADPASIGRPVNDPLSYCLAVRLTLSIHPDIDASSVPMRINSREN